MDKLKRSFARHGIGLDDSDSDDSETELSTESSTNGETLKPQSNGLDEYRKMVAAAMDYENSAARPSKLFPVSSTLSTPKRPLVAANSYFNDQFFDELRKKLVIATAASSPYIDAPVISSESELMNSPAFKDILEKGKQMDLEIERLRIEEQLLKKQKKDSFPPLDEKAMNIVKSAMKQRPTPVVSGFSVDLMHHDFATLSPTKWLNDEIINFYGQLIMERTKNEPSKYPKIHFFNTFFYSTLKDQGYKSVRRWSKKFDIFALDYVIIPVHLGMHWCCSVLNMKKKRIEYYDSLLGGNPTLFKIYRNYLQEESMDKKKIPFDFTGWSDYCPKDIPRQENGFDCGVFTCMFAEYSSREAEFDFSQEQMPYLRQRIVYELCTKQLLASN
ncbi:hypothetical protein CcCBS67573_g00139 [Chytriomyces confervae]|uniref:Ubiquitin-like protease family profile domain-containing protein n=1 Tax=Chytriomyces confervae TaxID=246404 RepID=A0A507FQK6_9FUNG|nr:hypothetical protein CcCBS67573_g00139 [Chytriomyces confervae]